MKQFLSIFCCAIFVSTALSSCGENAQTKAEPKSSVAKDDPTVQVTDKAARSIGLETDTVKDRYLHITQTLPGKIEPAIGKEVDISSRVAGRVDSLPVSPGETVEPGQVLAVLTSREVSDLEAQAVAVLAKLETDRAQEERQREVYEEQVQLPKALIDATAQLKQANVRKKLMESQFQRQRILVEEKIGAQKDLLAAEAALEQADVDVENAHSNMKREEALFKNKAVLRGPYQLAQAERIKAEKDLQALKSQLKFLGVDTSTLKTNLSKGSLVGMLTLRAPIKGVLSFFEIAPGELIAADKPIFKITDISQVLVSADVPESEIKLVRRGSKIRVSVAGLEKPVDAYVEIVGNHVDPATRSLSIRARLDNSEHLFKPGMFADVKLDEQEKLTLTVPKNAIQEIGGNKIVFVKTPAGFEKKQIKTGSENDLYAEVLEGPVAGDVVVTQGSLMLKTEVSYNRSERND